MLYIAYPITTVVKLKKRSFIKTPNFFLLFSGKLTKSHEVGSKIAQKRPGDLVRRAPPSAKPAIMAKSSLSLFAERTAKNRVQTPKALSIESARASLSKKTENGERAYTAAAVMATFLEFKRR